MSDARIIAVEPCRFLMVAGSNIVPLVVDAIGHPDQIAYLGPGLAPEYPRGLVLVSPSAWCLFSAHNLADAYRPDVPESAACAAGRRG